VILSTIKLNLLFLFRIIKHFVLAFFTFNAIYLKPFPIASASKQEICTDIVASSSRRSHRHYNDPKVKVKLLTKPQLGEL